MSDFLGHSRAGIRFFFIALLFVIPILVWREAGDSTGFLKSLWKIPVCFLITYLSALFPDIDIKSKSQKIIYLIIFVLLILLTIFHYYGWAAGIGIFAVLGILFKHRGFLHSSVAAFLIPVPLLLIPLFFNLKWRALGVEFYLSAVIGYFSHLQADIKPSTPNSPKRLGPRFRKKRKTTTLAQPTKLLKES